MSLYPDCLQHMSLHMAPRSPPKHVIYCSNALLCERKIIVSLLLLHSFVLNHVSPEEMLRFQNMEHTKKLDNMPHQSSQGAGKEPGQCEAPRGA